MKHWSQWALIAATILPVTCLLVYHACERHQRSQSLESQSIIESTAESKGIIARIMAKRRVAEEVVAGRQSLLQAAGAFRAFDEGWPRRVSPLLAFPDAASEDEAYCLMVIGYVGAEAPPDGAAELTRRLHAELDAMLRNGTLHLPVPEDAPSQGGS